MPVPKRKRSRARRDSRFANKGIKVKAVTSCRQCQEPLATHQACKSCGYYKGVKVLRSREERAEKRLQQRKNKQQSKQAREASHQETQEQ